ncbi:hypothetical protein V1514DRAFT_338877 [Lipomyces japonicus]|uniref:uncharacterized protein n=1 Tax=Lipomyces japonicus TaxID=56871 RepID=UPI0034CEEEF1
MSNSLSNYSSRTLAFLAAAGIATTSAVTVLATLGIQKLERSKKLADLKQSIDASIKSTPSISRSSSLVAGSATEKIKPIELNEYGVPVRHVKAASTRGTGGRIEYDPALIDEQLARNRVFLGEDGLQKIRESFVVVVGCGGVGSWVIAMLVRSGIGKIRIIDFDQVTLSSLNRHASATLEDVGTPKVESLRKYLEKVAPWVEVETAVELWNKDSADRLLQGSPTIVVDAIDNIDTKVDLLEYCYRNKIKVISAMGAGCKADPTRIQIDDISGTAEDPLARATRRRLRLRGIVNGITVVFSSEKPSPEKASLLPLDEEVFRQGKVGELGVLQDFRARILPVLGTMPGMFGLALATHILTDLGGYPVDEYILGRNRVKIYDNALHSLSGQRMKLEGTQKLPLDQSDVGYLIEEVFRGRSVVSRESGNNRIMLTKWLKEGDWSLQNIVLMTKEESKKHVKRVLIDGDSVSDVYPQSVLDLVKRRFDEEKHYSIYRE